MTPSISLFLWYKSSNLIYIDIFLQVLLMSKNRNIFQKFELVILSWKGDKSIAQPFAWFIDNIRIVSSGHPVLTLLQFNFPYSQSSKHQKYLLSVSQKYHVRLTKCKLNCQITCYKNFKKKTGMKLPYLCSKWNINQV